MENINKEVLYDNNPKKTSASLISGIFLVIGTVVGGGMFALPIALSGVWFVLGTIILILIGLMMLATGLMLVEVNLHFKVGASFNTFTKALLGKTWSTVVGLTLGFVLYILTYAYISGASSAITKTLSDYANIHIAPQIGVILVTIVVAAIVWSSSLLVGRITTILVLGKFTAFFITFSGLLFSVDSNNLLDRVGSNFAEYTPYILMTLPFAIISFGFHGNVPSMYKHFGYQPNKIVNAIKYGMLFTVALYIFWIIVSMGNIPRHDFGDIIKEGGNIGVFVNAFMGDSSATMKLVLTFFSNFAISASLLAATLGLFDYIADVLHIDDSPLGRLKTSIITYLPPGLICFFIPDGFVYAIGYAGLAFTMWSVILPPLLVKKARKVFSIKDTAYKVPLNNGMLNFILGIGLFVYLTVILDLFNYLPVFKG